MRNEIPNRHKTTWPNAATRLNPEEFYEPGLNQQIANRAMGGVEALDDSMRHLSQVEESKHEEGGEEAITESKSLMSGRNVGNNSSGNLKIPGSLTDRIAKTSIYGKGRKSTVGMEIEKIEKALIGCPKQVKDGKNWKEKKYQEKKKEIIEK